MLAGFWLKKWQNIAMQYHKYLFTLSAIKFDDSNILIKSALIKPSAKEEMAVGCCNYVSPNLNVDHGQTSGRVIKFI